MIESWIVGVLGLVTVGWILLSVMAGATLFRHPDWDYTFRAILSGALEDRPIEWSDLTEEDAHALRDLEVASASTAELSINPEASVRAALYLIGVEDSVLERKLVAQAENGLRDAAEAQMSAIDGVPFGRPFQRAWSRQKRRTEFATALAGLRWFAGRRLKYAFARLGTWLGIATAIGLVVSLVWALLLISFAGGMSLESLVQLAGWVTFAVLVTAFVVLAGIESWTTIGIVQSSHGIRTRRTVRFSIIVLLVALVVTPMTLVLNSAEMFSDWNREALRLVDQYVAESENLKVGTAPLSVVVGAILVGGLLLLLAWPFVRQTRRTEFRMSTRVFNSAGACFLFGLAVPFSALPLMTAAPAWITVAALLGFAFSFIAAFQVSIAAVAVLWSEHLARHREISAAGFAPPDGGLSAAAIFSWLGGLILTIAVYASGALIPTDGLSVGLGIVIALPFAVSVMWNVYALLGLAVAGVIISYRHIRKVDQAHRTWRYGMFAGNSARSASAED